MSCYLRFSAPDCDIDVITSTLALDFENVTRQGEPHLIRRLGLYKASGFQLVASRAGFDEFKKQIADTIAFIKQNRSELSKLARIAQALPKCSFWFDFGIETRMFSVEAQCDYFPPELVSLIGTLGAGIEFSQYQPSSEAEDDGED